MGAWNNMVKFLNTLMTLKRDEKGVTALEYGLIAALIAVVIIGAVTTLGGNLSRTFTNVANTLGTGRGVTTAPATTK